MPLLFATGAGAGSRVALGAAVVFGMAVNTIFATIYIPNWYEVMQHIQEKWLTKKKEVGCFTTDWSDLYGQLDLKTVWICVICGEFVYLCDKHMEIWIQ